MTKTNRREMVLEVFKTLLSHGKGGTLKAVLLGLLVWLAMDVFAHAAAPFLEYLIDPFLGKGTQDLSKAALHLVVPFLFLAGVALLVAWVFTKRPAPAQPEHGEVRTARGLIASLSPLRTRGADPQEVKERMRTLEAGGLSEQVREALVLDLYRTNWGPLAAAVLVHSQDSGAEWRARLEVVWLVCSGEAQRDADLARRMVALLTGGRARAEVVEIHDQNSVEEMLSVIEGIYGLKVPALDLRPEDVIADMTGGTSAMTAGMILATLDRSRQVEYLRQDAELIREDGHPKFGSELRAILRPVPTSPKMVAQAFARFLVHEAGVEEHAGH